MITAKPLASAPTTGLREEEDDGEQDQQVEQQQPLEEEQMDGIQEEGINEVRGEVVVSVIVRL